MAGPPVDFLYTNIGRGHPHYLDGIVSCMPTGALGARDDVFSLSSGPGRLAWRLARLTYRAGSSWPGLQALYSRFRRRADYAHRGPFMSLLGSGFPERYAHRTGPLVVAHPLLAGLLHQHSNLVYQHGELAVPAEAIVQGDHRVLVPDQQAARAFTRAGISESRVEVTGLCIEPSLLGIAERSFESRMVRLSGDGSLGVAMFSSGAEPHAHVASLVASALSLAESRHRVFLFARHGGLLHRKTVRAFRDAGLPLEVSPAGPSPDAATITLYEGREDLNEVTANRFKEIDVLVAPSHERTLWATGLGLPMLMLEPAIGTYAPLNRDRMAREGVGVSLGPGAAQALGSTLDGMRTNGELTAMAHAGWGRYEINGFQRIAELLI